MLRLRSIRVAVAMLYALLLLGFVVKGDAVSDSGIKDALPHIYGKAGILSLEYASPVVTSQHTVALHNSGTVNQQDADYTYRFRLKITDINDDGDGEIELDELTPTLRETPRDGGGDVDIREEGDYVQDVLYLSTAGLVKGDEYGMIGYTRLQVTSKVKKNGGWRTKSADWLVEPYGTFLMK